VNEERGIGELRMWERRAAVPERAGIQEGGPILVALLVLARAVVGGRREAIEVSGLTEVNPDVVAAGAAATAGRGGLAVLTDAERAMTGGEDDGRAEERARTAEPAAGVVEARVDGVGVEEKDLSYVGVLSVVGLTVRDGRGGGRQQQDGRRGEHGGECLAHERTLLFRLLRLQGVGRRSDQR
jgi:hypothetical protein